MPLLTAGIFAYAGSLQQLSGTQVSIVSAHEHLRTYEFDNVLGPTTSQEDIFEGENLADSTDLCDTKKLRKQD